MLLGPQGFTGIAMAGIDMAAWDVLARSAGLSLSKLLGGEEKPIPAYHSLGMAGPEGAAQEAASSSIQVAHGSMGTAICGDSIIRSTRV
jgi:mandelate racemase